MLGRIRLVLVDRLHLLGNLLGELLCSRCIRDGLAVERGGVDAIRPQLLAKSPCLLVKFALMGLRSPAVCGTSTAQHSH